MDAFPAKTLSFLRALTRNNDREWFHAHREEYETHVRGPMAALVARLGEDFRTVAPELIADPKVSLFRQWRDTRFSENKTPLKTNVAAVFPHRALGRMQGAGLYLEVAPKWVWIGGGIYAPDTSQLQAIREHIAGNLQKFEAVVNATAFRRVGGLKGEQLARVPRGFAKDHPAASFLKHRQFLGFREEEAAFATRSGFYKQLLSTFNALLPLCRFLNEPLVSMQKTKNGTQLLGA